MSVERIVRISLWVTAPANLAAASAFAFPSGMLGSILQLPATHPFYAMFSGALVGLFGLVYLWLALQAEINRPVLFIGACGKLLAVLISVSLFAASQLSGAAAFVISGDLVFVALWTTYLLRQRP